MTTVAYRNGMIAADTGTTAAGNTFCHMTKIARNAAGDLAGACGDAVFAQRFLDWFRTGEVGERPPAASNRAEEKYDKAAIFRVNGNWEIYEQSGMFVTRGDYYAMGSGRPEALGAMFMGAGAARSVEAAIALEMGTWGQVETLTHAG